MTKKGNKEFKDYAGAIVLGLNDAIVELTGALAGLTFALQNSRIIAVSGMITGFAAALSMAASEYLSSEEEADIHSERKPLRSAFYTGLTYLIAVILLVTPYILIDNIYKALASTVVIALMIIAVYSYYMSKLKKKTFARKFIEMALISFTVAIISFIFGMLLRGYL
nr:VIT1/CCC1 transporter family protein [Candidatus Woesearchaeota archaeon]